MAGNIQQDEAVSEVNKVLGRWDNRKKPLNYLPYQELRNPRLKVESRETEQTHLCLALPGLSLQDPRRFTLDLIRM